MEDGEMSARITQFSPCRKYRYTLWREWYGMRAMSPELVPVEGNQALHYLMVIGLNPSTADETRDNPTIRRCIDFAKRLGFGALCMTNLFAWRDTKPENMKKAAEPVGMDNHHWILDSASKEGLIIAAWGKHGAFMNQDLNARQWVQDAGATLHCLRKNGDGSPQHPLYIPADTQPIPYP